MTLGGGSLARMLFAREYCRTHSNHHLFVAVISSSSPETPRAQTSITITTTFGLPPEGLIAVEWAPNNFSIESVVFSILLPYSQRVEQFTSKRATCFSEVFSNGVRIASPTVHLFSLVHWKHVWRTMVGLLYIYLNEPERRQACSAPTPTPFKGSSFCSIFL